LAASVKKGRRPGFDKAEEPERAEALFDKLLSKLEKNGLPVKTGRFGQLMEVHLINDGPVTFILEKKIPNLPF
ncbi:MAG: D-aminoacyl-tRNA deacylase, partial [Acidobacteriota bacterium]